MSTNLISMPALVESPFIIVKIGDYTFGQASKTRSGNVLNVTFPNYVDEVSIVKVNGEVNTYSIRMTYAIAAGNDPNMIDHVLSSVSDTRTLIISYGDWASPGYIYKEEETLITNVKSDVDVVSSRIVYNISCVSKALSLTSTNFNFPARTAKPSDVLMELLRSSKYGVSSVFSGMRSIGNVMKNSLLATDDKPVVLEAKPQTNVLEYMLYLVNSMVPIGSGSPPPVDQNGTVFGLNNNTKKRNSVPTVDQNGNVFGSRTSSGIYSKDGAKGFKAEKNRDIPMNQDGNLLSNATYRLTIVDDNKNMMNGSYFKVSKVSTNTSDSNLSGDDSYEIDIGYPGDNFVTGFQLKDNEQWTILYKTDQQTKQEQYSYRISNTGELVKNYSPSLMRSKATLDLKANDASWWTAVTQFPISATLTLKGLVRPTILMSYVKLNVLFYGQRHISSGTYIITKQRDTINSTGYKTTLELLRVKGE